MRQTRLPGDKANDCVAGVHLNGLLAKDTTVLEEGSISTVDLQKVLATSGSFKIKFEVEDDDADSLMTLNGKLPSTVGVHEVLVGVVGGR